MNEILEKAKEYLDKEYADTEKILLSENRPSWVKPRDLCWNTIQRGLGVMMFIQLLDVKYEELDFYEEFRDKICQLEKKVLDKDSKQ